MSKIIKEVMVYDDPLTKHHAEGLAKIVSILSTDKHTGLSTCNVKFPNDSTVYQRRIKL